MGDRFIFAPGAFLVGLSLTIFSKETDTDTDTEDVTRYALM
jgi:hypothetical protein